MPNTTQTTNTVKMTNYIVHPKYAGVQPGFGWHALSGDPDFPNNDQEFKLPTIGDQIKIRLHDFTELQAEVHEIIRATPDGMTVVTEQLYVVKRNEQTFSIEECYTRSQARAWKHL